MTKEHTKALIKTLGGPVALADAINAIAITQRDRITAQAISLWVRIPQGRCLQIEKISNGQYPCHVLRPDVFPAPKAAA